MDTLRSAERPNWHLGRLDSLRGWAVLGVILVHASLDSQMPERWTEFARVGQRGVQLFFVLSAFTLFLSHDQRQRTEAHPIRNFLMRRLFRLTPMYYVAIVLSALLHPEVIGGKLSLLLGLCYLQWVTPYAIVHVAPGAWTLSVEAMFYLCLPLLFRLLRTLRQALIVTLVAAAALASLSALLARFHPAHYEYFTFLWFPVELPVFLLGIVVYLFWKRYAGSGWLANPKRARLTSYGLYLLAAATMFASFPEKNRTLYLASAGCALLLAAALVHPVTLLANRVTIFVGRISYSVYLLHGFVLLPLVSISTRSTALATHPAWRFAFILFSTVLLTIAAATLTWLLIEETGIRLGRRAIASLERRAAQRGRLALAAEMRELTSTRNSVDAQF